MLSPIQSALLLCATLVLLGCGGRSETETTDLPTDSTNTPTDSTNTPTGNGQTPGTSPTTPSSGVAFSKNAQWNVKPTAEKTECFDFDANGIADCEGTAWDIKVTLGSGTRDYPKFYTNSSPLGAGKGGALGSPFRFTWEQLSALKDTSKSPDGNPLLGPMFVTDSMDNGFASDNPYGGKVFAFKETNYTIFPAYPVVLITTDNSQKYSATSGDIYALQIVEYYNANKVSGKLTLNYVNLANASDVKTVAVDASSYENWVYFNLETGQPSSKDGTWHLAFNRYKMITNSADSSAGVNAGKVGSYLAQEFTEFYDEDGEPDFDKLQDASLISQAKAMLTNQSDWSTPKKAKDWKTDTLVSALNPTPIDLVMNPPIEVKQDYGFFTFTGKPIIFSYVFSANPERGVLLRSGEGNSYARAHLTSIVDGLYTFDFDVAPAAK